MKQFTCDGNTVSYLSACISDSTLCSGVGTCSTDTGTCICPQGYEGQYCEQESSSSSDVVLAVVLGLSPLPLLLS
jgi:hypothetical protein